MHFTRSADRPFLRPMPWFPAGIALLMAAAGCQVFQSSSDAGELRLIFDAGSSGTRLCLYRIERKDGSCRALDVRGFEECKPIPSKDGLAKLGPTAARDVVEAGIRMIDSDQRKRITSSALLGTGGFREKSETEQLAVLDAVDEGIKKSGIKGRSAVLTGEEEALLAWDTVRQIHGSTDHTTLETGGATVQMATGQKQPAKVVSAPIGMNHTRELLQKDPGFGSACVKGNYDACRALVLKKITDPGFRSFVTRLSPDDRRRSLYGLGTPWRVVFQSAGKSVLTIEEIQKLGKQRCAGAEAQKECYLFAYQGALLEAAGGTSIRDGKESWPRGAAASGRFFPDCADRR